VRRCRNRHALVALTISLAALFYSYPEGFILTGLIVSPFAIRLGLLCWKIGPQFQKGLAVVLTAALCLVAPYLPTWITFLQHQWSVEISALKAGQGIFPGLVGHGFLPAIFGLGEEFSKMPPKLGSLFMACSAGILCAAGVIVPRSWRTEKVTALLILIGLGLVQGRVLEYDYGLYKIIFIGSIVWLPALFVGLFAVIRRFPFNRPEASIGSYLCLQLGFLFARFENREAVPYQAQKKMRQYEQIRRLDTIVGRQIVLVDCKNDFEYEWALFYARQMRVQILAYKSYLKLFQQRDFYGKRTLLPELGGDQIPAYVLSDYPSSRSVWSNEVFWLRPVESGASLLSVDCPNGIESMEGKRFLWISDRPTKFFIFTDQDRTARLYSEGVVMGPSIPRADSRTLYVKLLNTVQEMDVEKSFTVSLQLRRGINEVQIWCKDKVEVSKQPNGDTRALLLGIVNYDVEAATLDSSHSLRIPTQ